MRSTSSLGGPLTEWCKQAGWLGTTVKAVGQGVGLLGKGIWHGAGVVAPNPIMRAGLLGTIGVGAATQVPQMAGRLAQDERFVRGTGPTVRGF